MTTAEVKDLCDTLDLAALEAVAESQERIVRQRIALGLPLDGAGDRLWLVREQVVMRRASDEA